MIHNVDFGWGLLGRLEKGGSLSVGTPGKSGPAYGTSPRLTSTSGARSSDLQEHFQQEDDEKSSFTREPDNVTFEQAESAVMAKPNE